MASKRNSSRRFPRPAQRSDAIALCGLLVLAGLAIAGPSGFFAWSENLRLSEARQARLAVLKEEHAELKNRVDLLDPNHADPDLAGELVRSEMGLVHPDEVVIRLED